MKISLQLAFFFFGITLYAQQPTILDQPYIETTAIVDTLVVPDRIHMSIFLNEADFKGKKSVEEEEKLMKETLNNINIDVEKDVALLDSGSDYEKYFFRGKDIIKYKSFNVIVKNATIAGRVLVKLEEVGISRVMITKTEYSKAKSLAFELKSLATKKAKIQAEALVLPLNQKIGKAIYIIDLEKPDLISGYRNSGAIILRGVGTINNDTTINPFDTNFEKINLLSAVKVVFALE